MVADLRHVHDLSKELRSIQVKPAAGNPGHPHVADTQVVLQTSDARGLYEKFGFESSGKLMSRPTAAMRKR